MKYFIRNVSLKNLSKYGKEISKTEMTVDLKEYFGHDEDSFINSLRINSDIEFKEVKEEVKE